MATAGGMGPGTIEALGQLLDALGGEPAAMLVAATDADRAGDRYAETFARMAGTRRITAHRLRPPRQGDDWNDVLRRASSWDTGHQFGQHKARQTEAADELFRLDPTRPVTEAALSGQELGNGA